MRNVSPLWGGVLCLVASAGGGCTEHPCDDGDTYAVCDIRDSDCVAETARVVACRRGADSYEVPAVRFVTTEELIREDARTDEEIAERTLLYRGLALVKYVPEGYTEARADRDYISSVPAFYNFIEDTIVINDTEAYDPEVEYAILVHEIVHAQQDQEFDLRKYFVTHERTFDRRLGARSAIEGEAVTYELVSTIEVDGYSLREIDWSSFFEDWQVDTRNEWATVEAPLVMASRMFPYPFGASLVFDRWRSDDRAGVEAVLHPPPESARQVLMSSLQTDPPVAPWNHDDQLAGTVAPDLGDEYRLLGYSFDGSWMVRAFLERIGLFGQRSPQVLQGLNSDVLSVHHHEARDTMLAVWRMRFDTVGQTEYLQTRIDEHPSYAAFITLNGDLVVVAGGEETLLDRTTPWHTREAADALDGAETSFGPHRNHFAHVPASARLRAVLR